MIASLGGSLLVIALFFTGLATMLVLAVHMEASLQRPRHRGQLARVRASARQTRAAASSPDSARVA